MFGIYPVNPDESLCASIAWSLWSEGRLATTLLQGALPGIEHSVYWTPPLYYLVLAGWMGLFGPGLLAVRSLSLVGQPKGPAASHSTGSPARLIGPRPMAA